MGSSTGLAQAISALAAPGAIRTIDDVIGQMEAIDTALPSNDGLKWFNLLYLNVTRAVKAAPPDGGWANPGWLTRLDVIFAGYYFQALRNAFGQTTSSNVPSAWSALFSARKSNGIDRIQFAMAGMNAHINHDLPLALVDTRRETRHGFGILSPEHADFEHVNTLLSAVLPEALRFLATGLLGELAQDTGKIGRILAMWNVAAARDLAWNNSEAMELLPPFQRTQFLEAVNRLSGVVGRALLLPIVG